MLYRKNRECFESGRARGDEELPSLVVPLKIGQDRTQLQGRGPLPYVRFCTPPTEHSMFESASICEFRATTDRAATRPPHTIGRGNVLRKQPRMGSLTLLLYATA